jgi:hypothetical protein
MPLYLFSKEFLHNQPRTQPKTENDDSGVAIEFFIECLVIDLFDEHETRSRRFIKMPSPRTGGVGRLFISFQGAWAFTHRANKHQSSLSSCIRVSQD